MPMMKAVRRQKAFAKEADIKGATGSPTGSVGSGGGKLTTPAKVRKKASRVPTGLKKLAGRRTTGGAVREAGHTGGDADTAALRAEIATLRERLSRCRAKGARLVEALRIRASADRAKKLLRESNLPPEVRPHLIDQLIGRSDEEMRREIARQERIIEAAAAKAKEDLLSDEFDDIEGAGSTLRESHHGSRRADDISDILSEVGLPVK